MDLDSITGRTEASRRALIRGAVVGIAGLTGVTAAQTDGGGAVSYLKDERNDDEESAIQAAELNNDLDEGGDGSDGDRADDSKRREVVDQVDLTERDGRVTLRLGAYERVIVDLNKADGDSVGQSAWRVDGKRAARSGVSFRAREGNTVQITLQNPTPIPYSLSIRTDDGDGNRVRADGRGVTVYGGGVETLVLDELTQGEYSYEVETLTRPIEPLAGRLLVDSPSDDGETDDSETDDSKTDGSEPNDSSTDDA